MRLVEIRKRGQKMALTTASNNGLTIKYETGEVSALSIDLDLDMRTGTPVDSQEWLKGFGTQYPGGGLDEFGASNSEGAAEGSLRLVVLSFTLATATEEVIIFTEGVSKIVGLLGHTSGVDDKAMVFTHTATGLDASPPAKTGGALPALTLHAEVAGSGTVSLLVLN